MILKVRIVDAFTEKQFGGNSAAVIITENWLPVGKMQLIAAQNNLSETSFLVRITEDTFAIRWFSPITEIDFCGHATLASAFILFTDFPELKELKFTASNVGTMTIKKLANGAIQMNFPKRRPAEVVEIPLELEQGLSKAPVKVLKNQQAYFAVYENEQDVLTIVPDLEKLKRLGPLDVVVTSPSETYDFCSRYFWPANGGAEDPVTGSIHTGLAPFWAQSLKKSELVGYQASKRTGIVHCIVKDDRVIISGHAVLYMEGKIHLQ